MSIWAVTFKGGYNFTCLRTEYVRDVVLLQMAGVNTCDVDSCGGKWCAHAENSPLYSWMENIGFYVKYIFYTCPCLSAVPLFLVSLFIYFEITVIIL
jgi:hypothetical protein